jgi:ABC-type transport system involved in multi-copper enzyme maturation permease subunit
MYRLWRNRAFYVLLFVMVAFTAFYSTGWIGMPKEAQPLGVDASAVLPNIAPFFIMFLAAFVGFFVATGFGNRTLGAAVSSGRSRLSVYLAKLAPAAIFTAAIIAVAIAVSAAMFTLINDFGDMPLLKFFSQTGEIFALQLVFNSAFACLILMFAFISQSPLITMILGVGYVFASMIAGPKLPEWAQELFPTHYVENCIPGQIDMVFIGKGIAVSIIYGTICLAVGYLVFRKREIK